MGSSAGIGKEIARVVALRGARVIKASGIVGSVEVMELDQGDLSSVTRFAEAFLALDVPLHFLVNNAAQLNTEFLESPQGFELSFAVTSLGMFHLTNLLLPKLKAQPSRIVNVTSNGLSSIDKERWLNTEQPLSRE